MKADDLTAFRYLKGGCEKEEQTLQQACCDGTRGNGFKLKEESIRYGYGYKEKVFMIRVVRCWHRLPREVVVPHPWEHPGSGGRGSEHLMEVWVSLGTAGVLSQLAL